MNISYEDHYEKYLPAYKEIAECNGGKTVWIPTDDHNGWYKSYILDDEDSEAWKEGYPNASRPSIIPDDLDPNVDRTAYTTISYAKDEGYKERYFKETEDGIEWMNNNSERLPDYGEICAWSLFVDIDIGKEYKKRPLPEEYKEVIENRLNLWIQAFSRMLGEDIDGVFALDSGGGMYVFTPPAALSPVYERYDEDELELIYNEIGKRMRSVTGTLNDLICEQDEGPKELFSADKVQNKNRQYKTIGSIHKDIDCVVYPINTNNIEIKYKPVDKISDDDVSDAISWSKSFTDEDNKEYVSDIIEYLFQGRFVERDDMDIDYVDGSTWKDILDNWVEEKMESISSWEDVKKSREKISDDKLKTEITQDREVAREAIRRLNNKKLKHYIKNYLGDSNTYEKNNEEMDFFPFWRGNSTESGRSAFYDYYEGKARFTDKADGTSRDIVYWIALEMTYDNQEYPNINMIESPGEDLDPIDYSRAIEELRNRGEDIPILVPEPDEDGLSEWRIIKIGKELGIVNDSDIVESDSYEKLKPSAWNEVLDRLESEGITHNCERNNPISYFELVNKLSTIYNESEELNGGYKYKDAKGPRHYSSPKIKSSSDFNKLLSEIPKIDKYEQNKDDSYIILFKYDGNIGEKSIDGLIAGTFIDVNENKNTTVLNRLEPNPVDNINLIESYEQIPELENAEELDVEDIYIFDVNPN